MLSVEVALRAKSGTACSSQLASFALGLPYLNSVLLVLYSTVLSAGVIAVQGTMVALGTSGKKIHKQLYCFLHAASKNNHHPIAEQLLVPS